MTTRRLSFLLALLSMALPLQAADSLDQIEVEGQPLAANIERLTQALDYLGAPLASELRAGLAEAARASDARRLQQLLDPQVLFVVTLNPEVRVKVARGPAPAVLQQEGYTPVLVKVINDSTATKTLRISSPQAGPPYAGVAKLSMERQRQEPLRVNENSTGRTDRFLEVDMFHETPMTADLSGLRVEYALALLHSSEAGKREATIAFDAGEGTQDRGFRGELPVLFDIKPAVPVTLHIRDVDGSPTIGRLLFLDAQNHVHPPQARRLAPDLFFQKHIYRRDGEVVSLPPGRFKVFSSRGPEYHWQEREITVPSAAAFQLDVQLKRWIDPQAHGFYSGDHHIHAAGCAHYTSPTEGVSPADMFRQVKGEGLNVGSVLTWGPCFDFQKQFFAPDMDRLSEPFTVLKYDIEVSGFGSQALGHVCLLNLKEQIYPGADGSKNWPTWTTPVLRWAKGQGAVTGYAHSGSGLQVNPPAAAKRLLADLDKDLDGRVSRKESTKGLLPEAFETIDTNHDDALSEAELAASIDRVADRLPNLAIPELNSVGAQEIFVTTPQGLCDFISAMDTARLLEWNCWYHLLNCGYPIKVSGETDFPCMSSTRVGQGRVYVQLGKVAVVNYTAWCEGIRAGRSYVSDGYAHALEFTVDGKTMGDTVKLAQPGKVKVHAQVAFSSETPLEVAYGGGVPAGGMRLVGDTVEKHDINTPGPFQRGTRRVEIIVNGQPVATRDVPADDQLHPLEFEIEISRSSWVALRQFPQLHTNPVNVLVGDKPIRASQKSALWAAECVDQLWRQRWKNIAPTERETAQRTFDKARDTYRKLATEAPPGS